MNCAVIFRVLPVLFFVGCYALEYSLLEELEVSCRPRDSCAFVKAYKSGFDKRSCECDRQCTSFRDCCIDKVNFEPVTWRRNRPLTCMAYAGQHKFGVYVVDTCPHNYNDSADIRNLCQEFDDFYDPLASAPRTAVASSKTYKNLYCAECNGVAASTLVSWDFYLHCETLASLHLNDSFVWENIKYNSTWMTWGIKIDETFHKCDVVFQKPKNLTAVRFCRANTIDRCPPSYLREAVKRLCESYSAVMYDSENAYKNPHCAICNNRALSNLRCQDSVSSSRNKGKPFTFTHLLDVNTRDGSLAGVMKSDPPFTFAHLLDVNPRDGKRVGVIRRANQCPSTEKWDPFFKKCRKMSCALPGFTLVDGKCKYA